MSINAPINTSKMESQHNKNRLNRVRTSFYQLVFALSILSFTVISGIVSLGAFATKILLLSTLASSLLAASFETYQLFKQADSKTKTPSLSELNESAAPDKEKHSRHHPSPLQAPIHQLQDVNRNPDQATSPIADTTVLPSSTVETQSRKLNIDDLLFMQSKGLGLRNQAREQGLREKRYGGRGDSYSLATIFAPAERLFSKFDVEELKFRTYALDASNGKPSSSTNFWQYSDTELYPEYSAGKLDAKMISLILGAKAVLTDPEKVALVPQKIKDAIVKQMKTVIKRIITKSLEMTQHDELERDVFHITQRGIDAQLPYDFKEIYPTGKCGTHHFDRNEILATVEDGLYFSNDADIAQKGLKGVTRLSQQQASPQQQINGLSLNRLTQHILEDESLSLTRTEKIALTDQLYQQEAKCIYKDVVANIKQLRKG